MCKVLHFVRVAGAHFHIRNLTYLYFILSSPPLPMILPLSGMHVTYYGTIKNFTMRDTKYVEVSKEEGPPFHFFVVINLLSAQIGTLHDCNGLCNLDQTNMTMGFLSEMV